MDTNELIALGGGAGGVGRSTLALELARTLARTRGRAIVVDASGWSPGLPLRLDMSMRSCCAFDGPLVDRLQKTPCGLDLLVLNESELQNAASIEDELHELTELANVILDLGAQPSSGSLRLFNGADVPILVTAMEVGPLTAVTHFVQRALIASLPDGTCTEHAAAELLHPAAAWQKGGLLAVADRLGVGEAFRKTLERRDLWLVVHHSRDNAERDLAGALALTLSAMTGTRPRLLGAVDHDARRWFHMRQHQLGAPLSSEEGIGVQIQDLAKRIAARRQLREAQNFKPLHLMETSFDLLGLHEGLDPLELRTTGRRLWESFRRDSPLTLGILEPDTRADFIDRVDRANRSVQAWLVEGHRESNASIDDTSDAAPQTASTEPNTPSDESASDEAETLRIDLGAVRRAPKPSGSNPAVRGDRRRRSAAHRASGAPRATGPHAVIDPADNPGTRIAEARRNRGVSSQELSLRTKIGLRYLDAIESFDVDSLPRAVYLRGYLREIADALELEPNALLDEYLSAVANARRPPILTRNDRT